MVGASGLWVVGLQVVVLSGGGKWWYGKLQYDYNEKLLTAVYTKQPPPLDEVLRRRDSSMPYGSEPADPLSNGHIPPRRMSRDQPPSGSDAV